MRLAVSVPHRIEVDEPVSRVRGDGVHGSFTLLPGHLDYVVILEPGILSYTDETGVERYAAVNGGVLTKVGPEVRVSTPAAVAGEGLEDLEHAVAETFRRLDERERSARLAQARIESQVMHEMLGFEEPR